MLFGNGVKEKHVIKILASVRPHLTDDEKIKAVIRGGAKFFTDFIVLTSTRIIEIDAGREGVTSKLDYSEFDPADFLIKKSHDKLITKLRSGTTIKWSFNAFKGATEDRDLFLSIVIPIVNPQVEDAMAESVPGAPYLKATADSAKTVTTVTVTPGAPYLAAQAFPVDPWEGTLIPLRVPGKKAAAAILRMCSGDERPWLVLVSFGAGLIAGFEDRLVVIKTGMWNSLMAGSLGGERAATIYFTDITGIEYNSGISNGVLEILTPSYSGTANKDYWKGSNSSFNADSNNPFTLSNTLPLEKSDYKTALPEINELRRRVSQAKQIVVQLPAQEPSKQAASLGAQLRELKELHAEGVHTDQEFDSGKAKLLG